MSTCVLEGVCLPLVAEMCKTRVWGLIQSFHYLRTHVLSFYRTYFVYFHTDSCWFYLRVVSDEHPGGGARGLGGGSHLGKGQGRWDQRRDEVQHHRWRRQGQLRRQHRPHQPVWHHHCEKGASNPNPSHFHLFSADVYHEFWGGCEILGTKRNIRRLKAPFLCSILSRWTSRRSPATP